jgi:phenylalanyl-tRNA synthetase beta chain
MPRDHAVLFGGGDEALTLSNPVASDLNQMRPSILANLAKAIQRGFNRGEREMRLFEAGPVYLGDGPKDQRTMIAGLVRAGEPRHWQHRPAYDAHSAKADLFAVLGAIGQPAERFQIDSPKQAHFHPGQSASLKLGPKVTIAHFGALHPRALRALNVEGPVYGFELNLNAVPFMKVRPSKTKPVLEKADLLPVRRDFAFVLPEAVPADDVVRAARGADKALISAVRVFDVYRGSGIPVHHKSIALEITWQPQKDTLTDEQIDALSQKVISAVQRATGGTLRG